MVTNRLPPYYKSQGGDNRGNTCLAIVEVARIPITHIEGITSLNNKYLNKRASNAESNFTLSVRPSFPFKLEQCVLTPLLYSRGAGALLFATKPEEPKQDST